jgi:hypothetical protein
MRCGIASRRMRVVSQRRDVHRQCVSQCWVRHGRCWTPRRSRAVSHRRIQLLRTVERCANRLSALAENSQTRVIAEHVVAFSVAKADRQEVASLPYFPG